MGNVQEKAANTKEMPERNFPVVPTTKILAIGQFTKPLTPEQIKEIFPREVPATLRLYVAGKIDQWWIRQTQTGPVFKREEQFDASVFILERKTYAESEIRSATKPGTG